MKALYHCIRVRRVQVLYYVGEFAILRYFTSAPVGEFVIMRFSYHCRRVCHLMYVSTVGEIVMFDYGDNRIGLFSESCTTFCGAGWLPRGVCPFSLNHDLKLDHTPLKKAKLGWRTPLSSLGQRNSTSSSSDCFTPLFSVVLTR